MERIYAKSIRRESYKLRIALRRSGPGDVPHLGEAFRALPVLLLDCRSLPYLDPSLAIDLCKSELRIQMVGRAFGSLGISSRFLLARAHFLRGSSTEAA